MSAAAVEPRFTLSEWSRIVSDPTKNRAYLECQLGQPIADYLSWKQNEDGARARTVDSYERVLAQLAVTLPHVGLDDLTIAHLRQVRNLRPEDSRHLVTAIYRDFCKWLYEEGHTDENVAGRLRYPKRRPKPLTDLLTEEEKAAIVSAQENIRDRVGVLLLLRAGLRKGELRLLRVQDVDLRERLILVYGKGGKSRRVPVRGSLVQALDEFLLTDIPRLNRLPEPDDHVLYREKSKNRHGPPAPKEPMSDSKTHRWWYECLQRAGVVDKDVTSGRRTHTTRHTYATDLGRATNWNMVAVQKNLGHSKIGTTIDLYTQFAFEDQELAVDALPEIEA